MNPLRILLASLLLCAGNTPAADRYPALSITNGTVLPWQGFTTNTWLSNVAAVAVGSVTNAGDYANLTPICEITHPGILSTNAGLYFEADFLRTNVFQSSINLAFYGGPNTNFLGAVNISGTTVGATLFRSSSLLVFHGATNGLVNGQIFAIQPINRFTNHVGDATAPFKVYAACYTTIEATNAFISLRLTERK